MSAKILIFKPRDVLKNIRPLTAIYMRGLQAGLTGMSHMDDIVFKPGKADFPKHRAVYFAGYQAGNIRRWSA